MGATQTKVITENNNIPNNTEFKPTEKISNDFQHPKLPSNVNLSDIPSECPMHQAKNKTATDNSSSNKIPSNVNLSDIPSECPMHQAKNKAASENSTINKNPSESPLDGKSDINPQNMVTLF